MKTLDLKQIGVQELTITKQMETDGGIAPFILYGLCYLAGVAAGALVLYMANQD